MNFFKKIFYYKNYRYDNLRPRFEKLSNHHHAAFYISCGSYFDNTIYIYIGLFFFELCIATPFHVKKHPEEIGAENYNRYGFEFVNMEGAEHSLFLYWKRKTKIIDMPWAYEHYRTTYFYKDGRVFKHDYTYSKLVKSLYPNLHRNEWETRYEYMHNHKDLFTETYDYTYTLNSGEVQHRKATINMEELEWRRKWLMFTKIGNYVRKEINIEFDDEVGERTGTWKGGVLGCSYDMRDGETMEQTLRRMERNENYNNMKIQIRKSVFETNSSSTHAIAIDKSYRGVNDILWMRHCKEEVLNEEQKEKLKKYPLPKSVYFAPGEFGWEAETYTDTQSKASYLITAMYELLSFDEFDDKINQFKKWLNEEGIEMDILPYHRVEDTYRSTDNYKLYKAEFDKTDGDDWFYIDHCSECIEFMSYAIATKSNLFSYLFGDSIIKTGNDNDDSDISFYETEKDEDGYSTGKYPINEEG